MSRHSDTKTKVLRGVYEDNAGIPRSYHGKRRTSPAPEPLTQVNDTGYQNKAFLAALLGLVALFGISFRLVTVDGTGPVAMQLVDPQSLQYLADTLQAAVPAGSAASEDYRSPALEPTRIPGEETMAASDRYDTMIARLGMPMADLFNLKVQTIIIDPGHGGIDPGATGQQGLLEKDVALDIAKRLRDKLDRSGIYRVLLTREDDRKVYLKERIAFAEKNRADLFISIHVNSLPPGSAPLNYVETYYFGPHTDQRSLELAEKENRDSDYSMGDFRRVIARIGDTFKTEESKDLAGAIHQQLYSNLKRHNRDLIDAGSKTGPFMVLLGVEVPSVLVEVSCISNKAEETRLSKAGYRDNIADYLQTGIVEYLEHRGYRRTIEGGKTVYVAKQER